MVQQQQWQQQWRHQVGSTIFTVVIISTTSTNTTLLALRPWCAGVDTRSPLSQLCISPIPTGTVVYYDTVKGLGAIAREDTGRVHDPSTAFPRPVSCTCGTKTSFAAIYALVIRYPSRAPRHVQAATPTAPPTSLVVRVLLSSEVQSLSQTMAVDRA